MAALSFSPKRRTKSSTALGRHSRRDERMARQNSTRGDIIKETDKISGANKEGIINEDPVSRKECSTSVRSTRKGHHSPRRLSPHRNKEHGASRAKSTPTFSLEAGLSVTHSPTLLPTREGDMAKESNVAVGSIFHDAGNLGRSVTKPTFHRSPSGRPHRNASSHCRRDASSPKRTDGRRSTREEQRQSKRVSASLSPTPTGRMHHDDDG